MLNEVLGLLGTVVITVVAEVVGLASGLVDVVKGLASLLFGIAKFFVRLIYDTIKADKDYHETVKYLMVMAPRPVPSSRASRNSRSIGRTSRRCAAGPAVDHDRRTYRTDPRSDRNVGTGAAKAGNLPKVMATVPVVQGTGWPWQWFRSA